MNSLVARVSEKWWVWVQRSYLERKSSGSGLENREYGHMDPLCSPRNTLYPQKLALTSPTSNGLSRAQATEFLFMNTGNMLANAIYESGSGFPSGFLLEDGHKTESCSGY
jgi:hypothetical protein